MAVIPAHNPRMKLPQSPSNIGNPLSPATAVTGAPVLECKPVRTYSYEDLVAEFLAWSHYREAEASELRRYYENRWRAYSAAFGITLTESDLEKFGIQARVSMPEIFFALLHRTAECHARMQNPVDGGFEAPPDFARLYQRHAAKLSATEKRQKQNLKALTCDLVRLLYGRRRRVVTDVELAACGIDAVPYPESADWD